MANKILKSLTIDGVTYDAYFVKITGDTMTGDLTYKTDADAKQTNNGVADTLYPHLDLITDKNGLPLSYAQPSIANNGEILNHIGVNNYDANGDLLAQAYILLAAEKNGAARAYLHADKPPFNARDRQIASTSFVQDAIDGRLGSMVTASQANTSVGNYGYANRTLWTADSNGILIGTLQQQWESNPYGVRMGFISINDDISKGVGMVNNATTYQCVTIVQKLNAGDVVKARFYQDSGSTLSVTNSFTGTFIKDYIP